MEWPYFFYKLYKVDSGGRPVAFLGNAFPIAPDGCMLTCRHVVQADFSDGSRLAIYDNERSRFTVVERSPLICDIPNTDMAIIPNALSRDKAEFFPILTPQLLNVGEDVYSYGFFAIGGRLDVIEAGYFGGKIVNFFQNESAEATMFTLPYPIIEGLSGSPVLTYHSGPKLVGMATGNRIARILASESLEFTDGKIDFKETINRIVEFGTAMHCIALAKFAATVPETKGGVVTHENCAIPHLNG